MRPIATYGVAWSVCPSVGLHCLRSVTNDDRKPCKTAEPIEIPIGMWIPVGLKNDSLNGVQILTREWIILRVKGAGQGHARTSPAVDILKETQQGHHRLGLLGGCTLAPHGKYD